MAGLLQGVTVLESAVLLTGDYLGMLLADQGAEVIKVEQPGSGDYLRHFTGMIAPANSAMHLFVNRNKKSVTINMRTDDGRALFYRLLERADVFVTGNIAQVPKALGMDYETLRGRKPDIVYCQATGFGAEGPYAAIPTHGQMMDALAGTTAQEMGEDGLTRPAGEFAAVDGGHGVVTGPLFAAYGIAAALFRRERTGEGSYIDVSCADAVLAATWPNMLHILNRERLYDRINRGEGRSKYQFYQTGDGKFLLFCGIEAKFWAAFCRAIERDDLVEEHGTGPVDFGNDVDQRRELQRIFATRTLAEWVGLAAANDIPIGPATDPREVGDDPQLRAREMVVEEEHPTAGRFVTLGDPVRVAGERFDIRLPAPALGEHTDAVLGGIGCSAAEIGALRARGIV